MGEEKKGFDYKTIAVVVLVLIAAVLGAYFMKPADGKKEPLNYDRGTPLGQEEFATNLNLATKLYIVMDIRNVSGDIQQGNILQCGTDFAGSEGIVGKEIIVYALEEQNCTSLDRMLTTYECISNALGGVAFFIKPGNGTTIFYEKKAIVGMGTNYTAKECSIGIKDKVTTPSITANGTIALS